VIIGSREPADVVEAARRLRIAAWGFAHGHQDERHLRATIVDEELPDGMGLFERTVLGFRFRLPGDDPLAHDVEDPMRTGRDYLVLITLHVDRIRMTLLPEWDRHSGCEVSFPLREDRSDVEGIDTNIAMSDYVDSIADMLDRVVAMDNPVYVDARAAMAANAAILGHLAHGLLNIPAHVDMISGDPGCEDMAMAIAPEDGPEWYPSPTLVARLTTGDVKIRAATSSRDSTLRFYDRDDEAQVWEGVLTIGLSRTAADAEIVDPDPLDLLRVVGEWSGVCEPHAVVSNDEQE
jgi:hypothetical protein